MKEKKKTKKKNKLPLAKCPDCGKKKLIVSIFGSICQNCFYKE